MIPFSFSCKHCNLICIFQIYVIWRRHPFWNTITRGLVWAHRVISLVWKLRKDPQSTLQFVSCKYPPSSHHGGRNFLHPCHVPPTFLKLQMPRKVWWSPFFLLEWMSHYSPILEHVSILWTPIEPCTWLWFHQSIYWSCRPICTEKFSSLEVRRQVPKFYCHVANQIPHP